MGGRVLALALAVVLGLGVRPAVTASINNVAYYWSQQMWRGWEITSCAYSHDEDKWVAWMAHAPHFSQPDHTFDYRLFTSLEDLNSHILGHSPGYNNKVRPAPLPLPLLPARSRSRHPPPSA